MSNLLKIEVDLNLQDHLIEDVVVEIDLDSIDSEDLLLSVDADDVTAHVAENMPNFIPLIFDYLANAPDDGKYQINLLLNHLNEHHNEVFIGFVAKYVDQNDVDNALIAAAFVEEDAKPKIDVSIIEISTEALDPEVEKALAELSIPPLSEETALTNDELIEALSK